MPLPVLIVPYDEAKQKIKAQIDKGQTLLKAPPDNRDVATQEFYDWYNYTNDLLKSICETEALAHEFSNPPRTNDEILMRDILKGSIRDLPKYLGQLSSIDKRLELYPVRIKHQSPVHTMLSKPVELVEHIARRFHLVAQQLRNRPQKRKPLVINDEYDVQYVFRALVKAFSDDIRPEETTPSTLSH